MTVPPALSVRGLRLWPPLVFAPMAGLTHTALRSLVAELGGVGLLTTEMLSARTLPTERAEQSPLLARGPGDGPLSYQLLASSPAEIPPACQVLHRCGAAAIDLNLGCPAPAIRARGGGSRLMERPAAARALVAAARRCTDLPLSAKIRLGERLDEEALRSFCEMLEGEGVDLLTVHARLRGEPYGRRPRWDWIGKVKGWVSIPVLGNGGIFSLADARRCLDQSGCDGLMLGRGAVVRPWLFRDVAAGLWGVGGDRPLPPRGALFERFCGLMEERLAPERRLGRLKAFTHYFAQTFPFGHGLATAVQTSGTMAEARDRAAAFFAAHEPDGGSP